MQKIVTEAEKIELFEVLKSRFEKHKIRHQDLEWLPIQAKLEAANADKIWSLQQMEITGGEPDVVAYEAESKSYIFYDCAAESPKGRRSLCWDRAALDERKEHKPENSAQDMADEMGVNILNEQEYRYLHELGSFDTKTSSWIHTPKEVRTLGGALFADFRFGRVFIYCNGVQSYYAARGFRAALKV